MPCGTWCPRRSCAHPFSARCAKLHPPSQRLDGKWAADRPVLLHESRRPWRSQQVWLVSQLAAQSSVGLAPRLKPLGERVKQACLLRSGLQRCGSTEESRAELGEPGDVVAPAHLLLEETCEEETLCSGRLEHQAVVQNHRIEHVVIEDGRKTGGGRYLARAVRGHLSVMRQDARVVKQLLTVNSRFGHVLKSEEKEFQSLAVIGSE